MSDSADPEYTPEQEAAAQARETAFFRHVFGLHDITVISRIGPLDHQMNKRNLWGILQCYREAVLRLMLGLDLPEYKRVEPEKKPAKRARRPR